MQNKPGLLVGVTGGIGSGKSTVCEAFRRLGRTVISADELAHTITDTDESAKTRIRRLLGAGAYLPTGALDRQRVAAQVFGDARLRRGLDAIVHPLVFEAVERRLTTLPSESRQPYVVIEAALIYESGMDRKLDSVIVVDAGQEMRLQRVMERDSCSREEVLKRMASQGPPRAHRAQADFVLNNDGSRDSLEGRVAFLDRLLTLMAQRNSAPQPFHPPN